MGLKIIKGNIFSSHCQTLVNTVNCVGVMGAGIALEYRLRYPDMHAKYIELCNEGKLDIGMLWLYKASGRWILNFPTKKHWKYPSKVEYLHAGLEKFVHTYRKKGIESIAFPMLGADKGGISHERCLEIMKSYLEGLDIEVEIYSYDPTAKDDLYEKTRAWLLSQDVDRIARVASLRRDYVIRIINGLQSPDIFQLNQLAMIRGIGIKTLEKLFRLSSSHVVDNCQGEFGQKTLF